MFLTSDIVKKRSEKKRAAEITSQNTDKRVENARGIVRRQWHMRKKSSSYV